MATITMLIGLPGSGKTTFAKSVENEGNSKPCKIHVVSSDTMREKLYGSEEIQGDCGSQLHCGRPLGKLIGFETEGLPAR